MPSFSLKDGFRRTSRSYNSTTTAEDNSSGSSQGSNGNLPTTKSTSTLNSFFGRGGDGSRTPPSQIDSSSSSTIAPVSSNQTSPKSVSGRLPPHPAPPTKRFSVAGMSGLGSPSTDGLPISPYAPRITSITDNTAVYCKTLLISGTIGEAASQSVEGALNISHFDDSYPMGHWPVTESHFKSLIQLNAGVNRLRLSFYSPKLPNSHSSNNIHSTVMTIHYIPQTYTPPLQLVILMGKDSPGTFDAVPARVEREGNGLETAISKYRMAAYLWQAYTADQMTRNKLGRRTFRFEEEWTGGTANLRDRQTGTMRSEARIHVIRSEKTVAEIRDIEVAQQNPKASRAGDLYSWACEDVRKYFNMQPGQKQYVSVLLLDSHWDKEQNMLLGHAALGGGDGSLQLAIFGSHALQSYPSCIEEVVPAFTDCTRTDTDHVANDCGESGSNWEAANIGIGAHMHEVGHLFGCPHQESGIMLRDYTRLNRSFITKEAFCTRTGEKGGLVLADSECNWHRLDLLRFRIHPAFKIPGDPFLHKEPSVDTWPVDNGIFMLAPSGLAYTEIYVEGEEFAKACIEHGDGNGRGPIQRQYFFTEQEIRGRLPEAIRKKNIRLSVKSYGNGHADVSEISASKATTVKIPGGKQAYRGAKHGLSQTEGSEKQEVIFESFHAQSKIMTSIVAHWGFALNGLEFFYEDSSTQSVGVLSGDNTARFNLDTRRGEVISGFNIRAGFWIDGVQIITSCGRMSEWFGAPNLGSGASIQPPRGFSVAGVSASAGQWMDGFQAIIAR